MVKKRQAFFVPHGRSPLERLARGLLVLGVFVLVVAAFSRHFRNLAEEMAARGTVADSLGVLSETDRAWIRGQAAVLKRRFGLELSVRLGGVPRFRTADDPKRVIVFLDQDCRQGRVTVPALVVPALPAGFLEDLGREHLDAACREGRAREGVLAAVGLLTTTLGEAASRGQGEGS